MGVAEGSKGFLLRAKERPMADSRAQTSGKGEQFLDHQGLTQWICSKHGISMQVGKVQVIEIQSNWRKTGASLRRSQWDGIHVLKCLPVLILWQIVLEKHPVGIFLFHNLSIATVDFLVTIC